MNKEDIIRMALEAGLAHFYDSEGDLTGITDARLVDEDKHRNDERLVEILGPLIALVTAAKDAEHQQTLALQQRSYEREIELEVEAEREACAVAGAAAAMAGQDYMGVAAAIRARRD